MQQNSSRMSHRLQDAQGGSNKLVQDILPILNIVLPHSPHLPLVAGRPFFIVTCSASWISLLSRHFIQYPVIEKTSRIVFAHRYGRRTLTVFRQAALSIISLNQVCRKDGFQV